MGFVPLLAFFCFLPSLVLTGKFSLSAHGKPNILTFHTGYALGPNICGCFGMPPDCPGGWWSGPGAAGAAAAGAWGPSGPPPSVVSVVSAPRALGRMVSRHPVAR